MSIGPKLPASEKANYYTVMLLEQLAFGAVAGLVVCGIAVATAVNAGQEQPFRIAISLLVVVFFSQLQDFFRRHSFSRSRADLALRSDAARFAVQLGLLGFFYRGTTPLEIDQILYIIALSSLVAILSIAPSISVPTLPIAGASQILARQARSAQWLVGSALMQWTTGNFFILVAGAMLGPVAVGALRACQNLIGATHIFFQAADNFVPPRASAALHSGGVTALKAMLRPVLATGLVVTLIICAILCYDPEMWLGLVYGAEFEHYGYVLYWLSAVYIFAVLASPARYALSAMELTFPLFKGYGVATVFSLFSAHILIYFLGIHGALVGLVTCDAILLYVFTASWFRHEYNHPE
jgi:O-antigen/teichoic acid export membrane protein